MTPKQKSIRSGIPGSRSKRWRGMKAVRQLSQPRFGERAMSPRMRLRGRTPIKAMLVRARRFQRNPSGAWQRGFRVRKSTGGWRIDEKVSPQSYITMSELYSSQESAETALEFFRERGVFPTAIQLANLLRKNPLTAKGRKIRRAMRRTYGPNGHGVFYANARAGKIRGVKRNPSESIYNVLKKAGIPMDHHESDLYVQVTPESREIVNAYYHRGDIRTVGTFRSKVDGKMWYEIPFAFLPFWKGKHNPARPAREIITITGKRSGRILGYATPETSRAELGRAALMLANQHSEPVKIERVKVQTRSVPRSFPAPVREYLTNPAPRSDVAAAARRFTRFTGHRADKVRMIRYPANPGAGLAVGPVLAIAYRATRDGSSQNYLHKFSPHAAPQLISSHDGRQLILSGGRYKFTERGIVDTARKRT